MKVGIIGAGAAGLVSAWLLDQECDVVLFEQQNRLGGHAHTIAVSIHGQEIPVEIGFEFFNAWLFPEFTKLLKVLEVPFASFPLTYCFYTQERMLLLSSCDPHTVLKQLFFPSQASTLLQFRYLIEKGKHFVAMIQHERTIEQFADSLLITKTFKDTFFYPFLSAGWGCTIDEFKLFSAYDVLSWITKKPVSLKPQEWYEIVGGISSYITHLVKQLHKTEVRQGITIKTIFHENENNKYSILESDGRRTEVDKLIIATNPQQAAQLLQEIAPLQDIYNTLLYFESFPATVAVHSDQHFMPEQKKHWSVANVKYNEPHSAITVYKPWRLKQSIPIFRSWVTFDNERMPENIYALEHYQHQKVTPRYFEGQKKLKQKQGTHNLWLTGCYMDNLDSHESAVASAIKVVEKIRPDSKRLQQLKNIIF